MPSRHQPVEQPSVNPSAMASNGRGTLRPSGLAAFRLMTVTPGAAYCIIASMVDRSVPARPQRFNATVSRVCTVGDLLASPSAPAPPIATIEIVPAELYCGWLPPRGSDCDTFM